MEEWKTGLERHLWEIQYTFIRQLQSNQEEIRGIFNEVKERANLQRELEIERAENKELKKFFGKVPLIK